MSLFTSVFTSSLNYANIFKYEFEIYRGRIERPARGDVRVLLHRTWTTEQSDPLDLCDPVVGRTSGEPFLHPKDHLVRSTS